jgi:Flp pilus assembly pilin Flp
MPMREVETETAMLRKSEPSHPTQDFAPQDFAPQDFTPQDATPLDIAALGRRATYDETGATAIEYALIAAGIGAAVAATVFALGTVANIF